MSTFVPSMITSHPVPSQFFSLPAEMDSHVPLPREQDRARCPSTQLKGAQESPGHHHDSSEELALSCPFYRQQTESREVTQLLGH